MSSFFSRLATKKSLLDKDDTDENDDKAAEFESSLEDLTNQVWREVSIQHPIVFDCHNMCDLVKQGKLNKFSIKMLKRLCTSINCPRFVATACVNSKMILSGFCVISLL